MDIIRNYISTVPRCDRCGVRIDSKGNNKDIFSLSLKEGSMIGFKRNYNFCGWCAESVLDATEFEAYQNGQTKFER